MKEKKRKEIKKMKRKKLQGLVNYLSSDSFGTGWWAFFNDLMKWVRHYPKAS